MFNYKYSFEEVALEMWEKLGFSQIDTSVLSRVLKGERLFTPSQLKTFCEVLNLDDSDEAYLFRCLSQDYMIRGGINSLTLLDSSSAIDTIDFLDSLMEETYQIFHDGAGAKVQKPCLVIQTYIDKLIFQSLSSANRDKLYQILGKSLYIYGRSICSVELPVTVLSKIKMVSSRLKLLHKYTKNPKIVVYLNILLGEAYYVAGGYSDEEDSKSYYRNAMRYNKNAIAFELNDFEKLVTLRNIIAVSIYNKDQETFNTMCKKTKDIILSAPPETRVPAFQLCGTFAKGSAIYNLPEPFLFKELALKHFQTGIAGGGVTEVSDIKTEAETIKILGCQNEIYLKRMITKGLLLAEHENMERHARSFKEMLNVI